jgi:hypothetical protein
VHQVGFITCIHALLVSASQPRAVSSHSSGYVSCFIFQSEYFTVCEKSFLLNRKCSFALLFQRIHHRKNVPESCPKLCHHNEQNSGKISSHRLTAVWCAVSACEVIGHLECDRRS